MSGITQPIRVVIIDDQHLFRHGLRTMLAIENDIEVVGEAQDGVDGLETIGRTNPDVVLIDAKMPRMDGIELVTQLRAAHQHLRTIVLTTFDADEYLFGAIRAGVDGYLLKDADPGEVVDAIIRVHAGKKVLGSVPIERLIERYLAGNPLGQTPGPAVEWDRLTDRERQVVRLIALGHSNREIGLFLFTSEGTIKNQVSSVLRKLGLRDRTQIAILASKSPELPATGP
ncbi:response regulator [Microbacterium sp. NPDC057650]|uniref:response regulator n=1 Tax=unclassified Microbacterium TaxID=2609290 RepID=UPI00366B70B6